MAGEWPLHWRRRRLGEVADVNWGDTSTTKAAYTATGFPAFSASGCDGYLPYADFARTGVVLSAIGAACGKTWLSKGEWSCIKNTIRFWATDPDVDTEFLYWLTRDPDMWPKRGSAQPFISQGDARALDIAYPPFPEQRAIAHILGTLDDKIELNRRTSETLEEIARALFKSWFVDFDPARAKMEGRDPGLPKPLADRFPARLVDSELGEIPEGWGVCPLSEVIEVNPVRPLRRGQVAPYLDMAHMPTRGHSPDRVADRPFGSGMRFVNGDTLFARITPCLENGKSAFVDFLADGQIGWGSTEYIVLRPKPPLPEELAYCIARDHGFREFAIRSMSGTSGRQRVSAEALSQYLLVVPPGPVATVFGEIVRPLFAQAGHLLGQSSTLAALRDALVPGLISGELRVAARDRAFDVVVGG